MGSPSVYLQGSYRNHTNFAGDSDVDVVVETSGVFYHNLTRGGRVDLHTLGKLVFRTISNTRTTSGRRARSISSTGSASKVLSRRLSTSESSNGSGLQLKTCLPTSAATTRKGANLLVNCLLRADVAGYALETQQRGRRHQ